MISKYSGRCKGCNKPYDEGEDIYWSKEDGGWHWKCWEAPKPPSLEQFNLAADMGFIQYRQEMPAEGIIERMQPKAKPRDERQPTLYKE